VVILLVVAGTPFTAMGHDSSIVSALSDGLTGLFSLAAIFTYAGPGWSEYQRGLAAPAMTSPHP
jgi:hypothetical protein